MATRHLRLVKSFEAVNTPITEPTKDYGYREQRDLEQRSERIAQCLRYLLETGHTSLPIDTEYATPAGYADHEYMKLLGMDTETAVVSVTRNRYAVGYDHEQSIERSDTHNRQHSNNLRYGSLVLVFNAIPAEYGTVVDIPKPVHPDLIA